MPSRKQSRATFDEISQLIWTYREERDWLGIPIRGLVISIALEAAELLEHYQWHDRPVGDKEALADELADVFIYGFEFAQSMDIDVADAMKRKLKKAAAKYPAEQFKGKTDAEGEDAWLAAKLSHRKKGL